MIRALINNCWTEVEGPSLLIGGEQFAFGRGFYETLRTQNFRPIFLSQHLDRLFSAAERTGLIIQYTRLEIHSMLSTVIQDCPFSDQRVRIIAVPDNLILYTSPLNLDVTIYNGVSAITVSVTRIHPSLKTTEYQDCYQAWLQAQSQECFEALLTDKTGTVFEGSRSNIFWVRGENIFTRKDDVLPGITRDIILQNSPFPVFFSSVSVPDLIQMDEVFITNSGSGIVPVIRINAQKIGAGLCGPVSQASMDQYQHLVNCDLLSNRDKVLS